jgi:hypothetical protein
MKAQLSLEFLLYVGIAMASTVAMLGLYLKGSAVISSYSTQTALEELLAGVNANANLQGGSFYAYLPGGFCNATATGSAIEYRGRTYHFDENVSLVLGGACGGGLRLLHTELLQNGTLLVS